MSPYNQLPLNVVGTNSTVRQDSLIENRFLTTENPKLQSTSEISTTEVTSTENGLFQEGVGEVGSSEIGFNKGSLKKHSISEISSFQVDFFKDSFGQASISQISTAQVGLSKSRIRQVSSPQVGATENHPIEFFVEQANPLEIQTSKIPLASSIPLQQFFSSHPTNLQNTTPIPWTNFLQGPTPFNLNLEITDLPTGQLAEATLTHFDANGLPTGGTLTLDDDANGLGWFIDDTPWENSEFNLPQTETFLRATPGSTAYGRYDLLTTILHELGHLAGIIHGNPAYDDRIQYINGSPTFLGNGYEAQLTHDLSHLADPSQLMSPYLAPGIRKLPSQLELQILADIRSNLSGRLPTATNISAAETAQPMQGITNGEFDELLANWQRQGDTTTENGQAILREDDPRLNRLSQNFLVPEGGSNILRFDLLETTLGTTDRRPPDAQSYKDAKAE